MPLKHTVEEIKLKNGIQGLLINVPDATAVRYNVQFRAGSHYVHDKKVSQTAHVMEHMSFGPNERFDSIEEFSQEFSRNGAFSNAWTGSIDMVYMADAALMEWDRILELQELSITKPRYTQEVLDTEKGNVREELIGYANDTSRIVWQRMMRAAGLERWYDEEELATLPNITLEDISGHFKRTHTLKNMRFVFVGDLAQHRQKIIDNLESWGLPEGELLPLPKESVNSTDMIHLKRPDLPNLGFSLMFFLNRVLDRRELRAMTVLNYILTGTMHSRIWGVARKRGICYGMGSWSNREVTGYSEFGIGGQVSLENAKPLFELIVEQLQLVAKEGVTQDELDRAKEFRLGALQLGTETVRSLASWYSDVYYDYGEIDYVDSMPDLIKGTTVEEIQRLAKEFVESGLWSFGGSGNIEESDLRDHYNIFFNAFPRR